ncbi:hypothetical protein OAV88_02920 [bacterium]|nr:hypothetical protein [bacterium]
MGNPEYQWGKKGDKNPNNPVGRMNQPRPECCDCVTDIKGTCSGDVSVVCVSDDMCNMGPGKDFRPCVFPEDTAKNKGM